MKSLCLGSNDVDTKLEEADDPKINIMPSHGAVLVRQLIPKRICYLVTESDNIENGPRVARDNAGVDIMRCRMVAVKRECVRVVLAQPETSCAVEGPRRV